MKRLSLLALSIFVLSFIGCNKSKTEQLQAELIQARRATQAALKRAERAEEQAQRAENRAEWQYSQANQLRKKSS